MWKPEGVAAEFLFLPVGVSATEVRIRRLENALLQVAHDFLARFAVSRSLVHLRLLFLLLPT